MGDPAVLLDRHIVVTRLSSPSGLSLLSLCFIGREVQGGWLLLLLRDNFDLSLCSTLTCRTLEVSHF